MIVQASHGETRFAPIDLHIRLESREELDQFYAVFNHVAITDCIPKIAHAAIRETLREMNGGKWPESGATHSKMCDRMEQMYG